MHDLLPILFYIRRFRLYSQEEKTSLSSRTTKPFTLLGLIDHPLPRKLLAWLDPEFAAKGIEWLPMGVVTCVKAPEEGQFLREKNAVVKAVRFKPAKFIPGKRSGANSDDPNVSDF